ncbi:uncharacterized protein LOC134190861 [Corticium candelabrum]|uniref:uncharacterized protein LOC134190861 n=1 Tax=Corticium candelabrum TaxID=121492 RepID=UPI002E26C4AC|nr:uncharacterized protein LOC134190861 [Corticium candelabrum]
MSSCVNLSTLDALRWVLTIRAEVAVTARVKHLLEYFMMGAYDYFRCRHVHVQMSSPRSRSPCHPSSLLLVPRVVVDSISRFVFFAGRQSERPSLQSKKRCTSDCRRNVLFPALLPLRCVAGRRRMAVVK